MNIFRYEQQVKHIVTDLLSIISAVICFDWWSSLSCFICSGSDLFFFDLKEILSSWSSTWFLLWVFLLWSLWLDSLSTKRRQVRGQSRFCRTLSWCFLLFTLNTKSVCGGVWLAVLLQGRWTHLQGICKDASPG